LEYSRPINAAGNSDLKLEFIEWQLHEQFSQWLRKKQLRRTTASASWSGECII
jgi:hypothetical protein